MRKVSLKKTKELCKVEQLFKPSLCTPDFVLKEQNHIYQQIKDSEAGEPDPEAQGATTLHHQIEYPIGQDVPGHLHLLRKVQFHLNLAQGCSHTVQP